MSTLIDELLNHKFCELCYRSTGNTIRKKNTKSSENNSKYKSVVCNEVSRYLSKNGFQTKVDRLSIGLGSCQAYAIHFRIPLPNKKDSIKIYDSTTTKSNTGKNVYYMDDNKVLQYNFEIPKKCGRSEDIIIRNNSMCAQECTSCSLLKEKWKDSKHVTDGVTYYQVSGNMVSSLGFVSKHIHIDDLTLTEHDINTLPNIGENPKEVEYLLGDSEEVMTELDDKVQLVTEISEKDKKIQNDTVEFSMDQIVNDMDVSQYEEDYENYDSIQMLLDSTSTDANMHTLFNEDSYKPGQENNTEQLLSEIMDYYEKPI